MPTNSVPPTQVGRKKSSDERLMPEAFRVEIEERGVIDELKRRHLWRTNDEEKANCGEGLGFDDLFGFYLYCNPPFKMAAHREKLRSGKRLIAAARLIRRFVRELAWLRSIEGISLP